MSEEKNVKAVQMKILEIMKYIDCLCRKNGIEYYIMGGTALGAIRHEGFIPWDDDLDIFMVPEQYDRFKSAFEKDNSSLFVIQEWRTTPDYLEYAKVRMNGTTFIENSFKDRKDLHQGIYVDIMMLHKVPEDTFRQKLVYYESKFVTLYALSQRNWKPKTQGQAIALKFLKFLPCKWMAKICYKRIYKYDNWADNYKYCYWITPAKFRSGLFEKTFFTEPIDISFEDTVLYGSTHIKEYLQYRYGDYMKLPSEEQRAASVHAMIFDVNKDYSYYLQ